MRLGSLFQILCRVVPWQLRRPVPRDAMLWHDAEFQIMLRELRYLPIQRSRHLSCEMRVLSESRQHQYAQRVPTATEDRSFLPPPTPLNAHVE